jgi:hypothetical protein
MSAWLIVSAVSAVLPSVASTKGASFTVTAVLCFSQ